MARKNDTILNLLSEAPSWVSVVVAGAAFLVLRYILPSVAGEYPPLKIFTGIGPIVAPWVCLLFLIPAPISAYNSWRKRKLLDKQKEDRGL